jgi:hypothetical protein
MEKSNQERLKEYLLGDKLKNELGYLQKDISNGKVIMLSGKWGSGKTFFWKELSNSEIIQFQEKNQKAYVYCSLYGNTSIEKIEDNVYAQAYLCSVGGKNAVLSGYEKVKDFGKRFGSFCSLLDVSKLVDGIDDIQQKNIKKSALSYLENGGIVCFDDFERKSKDIDLNDLFGFISHLAIDLNCKVVIILNDDVFEGVEKDVFSNVKEKSVSKFLKYEPSIKELFKTIFYERREDNKKKFKYLKLRKYKQIILKTIEETQELNARIYIQVLDNLVEWIEKEQEKNDDVLRCLILVNINYILYHKILEFSEENNWEEMIRRYRIKDFFVEYELESIFREISKEYKKEYLIDNLISNISKSRIDESNSEVKINNKINFIKTYRIEITSIHFAFSLDMAKNVDNETFQKINNFIETGILIDE